MPIIFIWISSIHRSIINIILPFLFSVFFLFDRLRSTSKTTPIPSNNHCWNWALHPMVTNLSHISPDVLKSLPAFFNTEFGIVGTLFGQIVVLIVFLCGSSLSCLTKEVGLMTIFPSYIWSLSIVTV